MTHKTPVPAMPMGTRYDPALSLKTNAQQAWQRAFQTIQAQRERGLKLALRHAFALTEPPDFFYLDRYPRVPLVELEEELIAYQEGGLSLASRCGDCGEQLRFYPFSSLSDFGEVLDRRDAEDAYVCHECQYKDALAGLGKRR